MSTNHVYRLKIDYPEGIDRRNPPAAWLADTDEWGWETTRHPDDVRPEFSWPPERRYLSKSAALHRAERLIRYGCTVQLQRASVGEWTDEP